MKCKHCHNEVERTDLFCRYCGSQLYKSQKKEISVPKPKLLASGSYSGQLMVDGKRCTVTAPTIEEYEVKARAMKLSLLEMKKAPPKLTLGDAIDRYIEANRNVLSPSTIRGYSTMRRNRFKAYMGVPFAEIDYQTMVNEETEYAAPKTIANAVGLVKPSLKACGFAMPDINLPTVITPDLLFLDYKQVKMYLKAIENQKGELASLLALHSLRMSEILAVTRDDIIVCDDVTYIRVNKAIVPNDDNVFVEKITKTEKSTRMIPVMIPRLLDLLPESGRLVTCHSVSVERYIQRACERAGVPYIGCHGLRRTFASLSFHLKWDERSIMQAGGWSNMQTVHKVYIKLAQQDFLDNVSAMADFYKFTLDTP